MNTLLEVTDLRTRFHTPEGTIFAVNGVSFTLHEAETLAVVGESGCGKSVTMMSLLGLIPMPPGEIISGKALYRGKDLLLIDTPGFGFGDMDHSTSRAGFLASRSDVDTQLVLSSSMKSADLTRVVDSFECFRPRRLLFTKLDETVSFGSILNETARTGKPLSFFGNGQRIPEDLETASRSRVSKLVFAGLPARALSAA